MVPPEKVELYRNVRKLAQQGTTAAERQNAQARIHAMEEKYPGIATLAATPAPTPGAWESPFTGGWPGFAGGFGVTEDDVLHAAKQAADWMRQAAQRASNEHKLREIAENGVDIASRFTARNRLLVTVEIDAGAVASMFRQAALDPDALNAIATMIGADVAGEITAAIEEARR